MHWIYYHLNSNGTSHKFFLSLKDPVLIWFKENKRKHGYWFDSKETFMVCLFVLLGAGGNVGNVFAINSSGVILVAKKLDRETKDAYELTITAEDRAGIFLLFSLECCYVALEQFRTPRESTNFVPTIVFLLLVLVRKKEKTQFSCWFFIYKSRLNSAQV